MHSALVALSFSAPLCLRAAPCQAWEVIPVSSLHKITARHEGQFNAFPRESALLQATRGEWENFQVVLRADTQPLKSLKITIDPLRSGSQCLPASSVHLFHENFVYVAHPSGNRELTPQWWPDALLPLEGESTSPTGQISFDEGLADLAPQHALALWVNVRVPTGAQPGRYTSDLRVSTNQGTRVLPFAIRVIDARLPAPTYHATVAVYYDVLRDWYRKVGYSFTEAEWDAQKKRYYDFLLDYRLCAYDLPVPWNAPEAERYVRDPRVHSVRLPPLSSPDFALAQQLVARTHTQDKAFYYRIDEPTPERFKDVRATAAQLHARDPQLRHLVTVHPNVALSGAVDIWCPDIGDIFGLGHLDLEELARQRRLGRGTWFYTMIEPKSPYPTWLLDDDATKVRIYGPIMARYGIEGFVYSMVHGWGPHPLQDLTSFAGTSGDGTLLYPAELAGGQGLMPSIRLMLLRDALEDAELLKLVSQEEPDTVWKWTAPLLPIPTIGGATSRGSLIGAGSSGAPYAGWKQMRRWLFEGLSQPTRIYMAYPFSLSRETPLSLTRTTAGFAPHIDGHFNDPVWNEKSRIGSGNPFGFARDYDDPWETPLTQMWAIRDARSLYVAVKCAQPQGKEWAAIEIAPINARERWRFVVTRSGTLTVEHHTREGRSEVKKTTFQGEHLETRGAWNAEFRIPLELLGNPSQFRFNAIRRTQTAHGTRVLLRFTPDAGDVTLMPVAG